MQIRFYMGKRRPKVGGKVTEVDAEFVAVKFDNGDEVCRPAVDADKTRWKAEYAAFKAPKTPAAVPVPEASPKSHGFLTRKPKVGK